MSGERDVAENLETLRSMFPDHTEEQLSRALDVARSTDSGVDIPAEVQDDPQKYEAFLRAKKLDEQQWETQRGCLEFLSISRQLGH